MTRAHIRSIHREDFDAIVRLWEETANSAATPVYTLSEVLSSCEKDIAVVAVHDETVIGAAVGRPAHAQAWIVFHGVRRGWEDAAATSLRADLLRALEQRMAEAGLSRISAILPHGTSDLSAFELAGFEMGKTLHYVERNIPIQRQELDVLEQLGGRILPPGLWEGIGGMSTEKQLLEHRLVTPLSHPALAEQFGVVPPRAVMLFGPPGTGKTTFAKAIASRLEWSFVEVFPSRLGSHPGGLASGLRETFNQIAKLEHAVVFIDEVEEIAAQRHGEPPSPLQGVTNELLKIIPAFRDQPGRLLVCATNFIRALDQAFLRHGRFDYVIPIGLPDREAREAIWRRYIPAISQERVNLADLVERSQGFSPADIEYAARLASQQALERAVTAGAPSCDGTDTPLHGPEHEDYTTAIGVTRATVSPRDVADFQEDIKTLGRT